VEVLLLNGTVGSGKTTVMYEIADVLTEKEIPHAALDLDVLRSQWPPSSPWNANLMFDCLAALSPIYAAHGATRLVLAHVLEERAELQRYAEAIPGAEIVVVRITAPEELRRRRLQHRMLPGESLDWHLARTVELEAILSAAKAEDLTVANDDRPVRDVAKEVLDRTGWL
jgi:adenylylsulfate kinase